jgi:hypothetical protein
MLVARPQLLIKEHYDSPIVLDLMLHGANYLFNLIELVYISPRENYEIHYLFYGVLCIVYASLLKIILNVYEWAVYPFVASGVVEYIFIILTALLLVIVGDISYNKIIHRYDCVHKQDAHKGHHDGHIVLKESINTN